MSVRCLLIGVAWKKIQQKKGIVVGWEFSGTSPQQRSSGSDDTDHVCVVCN